MVFITENKPLKFFDLFAGIGGFRMGLENAGHKCIGWCEKDEFAQKSYRAIYDTEGEWFEEDAKEIQPNEMPEFDILTAGFPCQSFSIAGNRGGFEDTRGTLFFEIMRLAKKRQPKYLFLENVKGLLSHNGGKTFGTILTTMGECGYDVEYQVFNSKNFGVPQNRERVFIIGHLRGTSTRKVFPIRRKNQGTLKEHTSGMSQGYRVYDTDGVSCTLADKSGGLGAKTGLYLQKGLNTTEEGDSYCIDSDYHKGISPDYINSGRRTHVKACLTPERLNKRQNGRRFKEEGEPMFTLTGQDIHGVGLQYVGSVADNSWLEKDKNKSRGHHEGNRVYSSKGIAPTHSGNKGGKSGNSQLIEHKTRIRKLTPRECWRLQGFPRIKMEGLICYNNVKSVEKNLNTKIKEKLAQKTVHINYEGKTLVLRNQKKSFKFANGVGIKGKYHPYIQTEDFVVLSVGMLQILEKIACCGKKENLFMIVLNTNTIKKCKKLEKNLSKIKGLVNAVEKDIKMNWTSMPTTKKVLNTKNLDMISKILFYFVSHVMQPFIEIKKNNLLKINIDWDWAFEHAAEVNSDTQLYRQAGNAVTVNVVETIASKL